MRGLLTQAQIEDRIVRLVDALEDGTSTYADTLAAAANAEADYKAGYYRALLDAANRKMGAADLRKAWAEQQTGELRRLHLIADASRDAARDHQFTTRAALDAMRTLAANVRSQT